MRLSHLLAPRVVFCDTEEHSCLIDPEAIERLITKNTKCIIPVHLFGQSANMSRILDIAKRYDSESD